MEMFIYFMMMLMAQSNIKLAHGAEAGDADVATSRPLRRDTGLPIFVVRRDLAEHPVEAVELCPGATFADVLGHCNLDGVEDIVVTHRGQPVALGQPLSDAGVCAESVIEIGRKVSDVETLFRIFEESEGTQRMFRECIGFATYQEFVRDYTTLEQQRDHLKGSRHIGIFEVTFESQFVGTMHITGIDIRDLDLRTTINWEAVNQLKHLEVLSLHSNALQGSIDFAQLPKSLKALCLVGNNFNEVLHPEALESLLLLNNYFSIGRNSFPSELASDIEKSVRRRWAMRDQR